MRRQVDLRSLTADQTQGMSHVFTSRSMRDGLDCRIISLIVFLALRLDMELFPPSFQCVCP